MTRLPVRVVWAIVLSATWACGVPTDPGPRALPDDPNALAVLDRPTAGTADGASAVRLQIFLIRGCGSGPQGEVQRLAAVDRDVPAPADLRNVLGILFNGPTREDVDAGLCTALPGENTLSDAVVRDGVAQIDVTKEFDLEGYDLVLAIAQIVFTADRLEGIESVTFLLDGRPVAAPEGNGRFTTRPLRADDFREFLEP